MAQTVNSALTSELQHCQSKLVIIEIPYEWQIDNYSLRSNGETITSATFSSEYDRKTEWRLELIPPNPNRRQCYTNLLVHLVSADEPAIWAKFSASIIRANSVEECDDFACNKLSQYTVGETNHRSCTVFRNQIPDNEKQSVLPNNTLTLRCLLTVQKTLPSILTGVKIPECSVYDQLGSLLQTQKFADLAIIANNGVEYKTHRAILATRSEVFCSMLETNMKENRENQVEITDVDPDVLREVLAFIYTDKAPKLATMAEALLVAADKYMLDKLRAMCEAHLCANLTVDESPDLLILADMHSAHQLKTAVAYFILSNIDKVKATHGWNQMVQTHPKLIAELLYAKVQPRYG